MKPTAFTRSPLARHIARIACLSMLASTITLPAHADLISARSAAQESQSVMLVTPREQLQQLLNREEVARVLQEQGVSIVMTRQRVAALTDDEVSQLLSDIESAPAGAGIVGAAVFVFLVLLATDILGLTKVFPFTQPVR